METILSTHWCWDHITLLWRKRTVLESLTKVTQSCHGKERNTHLCKVTKNCFQWSNWKQQRKWTTHVTYIEFLDLFLISKSHLNADITSTLSAHTQTILPPQVLSNLFYLIVFHEVPCFQAHHWRRHTAWTYWGKREEMWDPRTAVSLAWSFRCPCSVSK